jgi:hypothetical protein
MWIIGQPFQDEITNFPPPTKEKQHGSENFSRTGVLTDQLPVHAGAVIHKFTLGNPR